MDRLNYITSDVRHKKGKHLTLGDRHCIATLTKQGKSCRYIARQLNCSPTTISNEIKRGTLDKASTRGRPSVYSPTRAQTTYKHNRQRCGRRHKLSRNNPFLKWIVKQVTDKGWSLDTCCGYAKKNNLFEGDRVCTKTLYNSVRGGLLEISLSDLPEALSRRQHKRVSVRSHRKHLGRSIDDRPAVVTTKTEFGHWEIDTVVGKRAGKEAVVLTLVEKMTHNFIAIKIGAKNAVSVKEGLQQLHDLYDTKFHQVFRTITADNGSEFSELANEEQYGTRIYFAHPYSSWERPQNERHNRIFRSYLPKKQSVNNYSAEQILWFADQMNSIPRKSLGYKSAEELFDECLDKIYATL